MNNLLYEYLNEAVAKQPSKIAIKSGQQMITYHELMLKSLSLSKCIDLLSVKKTGLVAIFLEKSIEFVVAMHGILYSGFTYIPLDSRYSPLDRVIKIIIHSEVDLIITDCSHLGMLEEVDSKAIIHIPILLLDEKETCVVPNNVSFWRKVINPLNDYSENSMGFISPKTARDDLAYILYTSGSTGEPKGVMISHRNACEFINWAHDYIKPTIFDVFASIAPFHFDLSVFDLYVSIKSIGTLVLLPERNVSNPTSYLSWIKDERISVIYTVPTFWVSIFNYSKVDNSFLTSLRKILFAGEIFPIKYLNKLLQTTSMAEHYNLYGPTETNVCTCYEVKDRVIIGDSIPIGKECGKSKIVILDDSENIVSNVGKEGELCVLGPQLTKGYYKMPNETSKYLKDCHLKPYKGKKIYHTGDIVSILDNNNYRFIGRNDSLIKKNGFRIELMEIETVLYRHKAIEEVVVLAIGGDNNDNLICSAIRVNRYISIIELKNYIAEYLPKYMIPDIIKIKKELPQNSNEKIDRYKIKQEFIDEYL